MQRDTQPTKYCMKCMKHIRLENFILHQLRCGGQSQLKSRRRQSQIRMPQSKFNPEKIELSRLPSNNIKEQRQPQEKVPCHFCGYMQSLAELDTHPSTCQHRDAPCPNCHGNYPISLMEDHQIACPSRRSSSQQQRSSRRDTFPLQQFQYDQRQQQRPIQPLFYPQHRSNSHQQTSPFSFFQGMLNSLEPRRREFSPQQAYRRTSNQGMTFISMGGGRRFIFPASNINSIESFFQLIQHMAQRGNRKPGLSSQQISQLQKIKYQINPQSVDKDLCTICYCEFEQGEQINKLKCSHLYHPQCIGKWLENNAQCPVCKKSQLPENQQRERDRQRAEYEAEYH